MQGTEMHLLLPPGDTATLVRGQAGPGRAHCSCPASTAHTVVLLTGCSECNRHGAVRAPDLPLEIKSGRRAPGTYAERPAGHATALLPPRRDRGCLAHTASLVQGAAMRTPSAVTPSQGREQRRLSLPAWTPARSSA